MTLTLTKAYGLGTFVPWDHPQEDDVIYRQSTRESLALCGGRVLLDGDDTPSEAMSFGTLAHSLIEYRIRGLHVPMLKLQPWVIQHWTELLAAEGHELTKLASKSMIDASSSEAIEALTHWENWFWNGHGEYMEIIGVEELRLVPLGMVSEGRAAWLQGTPDLVTAPSIEDFKTTGQERTWAKGKHEVRVQAPLYAYLEQQAGTIELPIPFNFQVYGRKEREWKSYGLTITQGMVDAALAMAWADIECIATGSLPYQPYGESFGTAKRGWHCSAKYCQAWSVCEVKHVIADGKANDVYDPHWG